MPPIKSDRKLLVVGNFQLDILWNKEKFEEYGDTLETLDLLIKSNDINGKIKHRLKFEYKEPMEKVIE
jgi:hypothetical protein